jgi:hypothetical protein
MNANTNFQSPERGNGFYSVLLRIVDEDVGQHFGPGKFDFSKWEEVTRLIADDRDNFIAAAKTAFPDGDDCITNRKYHALHSANIKRKAIFDQMVKEAAHP